MFTSISKYQANFVYVQIQTNFKPKVDQIQDQVLSRSYYFILYQDAGLVFSLDQKQINWDWYSSIYYYSYLKQWMINFLQGLCSCFNPEIKRGIIEYLSSAPLNRQVIEEQKCSQENEAPQESIYAQVKTKSYYFMKLKQEQEPAESKSVPPSAEIYDATLDPNYYPDSVQSLDLYDQLYTKKLAALQTIFKNQMSSDYSKIYDSQDDINLRIYCRQQIHNNRRYNSYRFSFKLPHGPDPQDYLALKLEGQKMSLHEPLLVSKEMLSNTQGGVEISHRRYKKILVISQHDFYTAEKSQLVEEKGQLVAYHVTYSVKGDFPRLEDHCRGWIHLAGLRLAPEPVQQEQSGTSLREQEGRVLVQGYINCELQISVNANMLKQPVAKEIRVYVQKLICSLTQSDAI